MRDPRVRAHGLPMEPIALPVTGDVIELLGAHVPRYSHLPSKARSGASRPFESEADRMFRNVVVGVLVVGIGLGTWLRQTARIPVSPTTVATDAEAVTTVAMGE